MYESKKKYFYGTGRRKSSVARVRVYENGTGSIIINGRDIDDYFGLETLKLIVRQPLVTTDMLGKVDIVVTVAGGGVSGQAGAIRHGVARALVTLNPENRAALKAAPIICCGESLETREAGKAEEWVEAQVTAALKDLTADQVASLVIAYEPIWAIGTGKTATADQAQEICAVVRQTVAKLYNQETADNVRIQYGGSVKPANVKELMAKEDIDGGLVGGASLVPDSYLALVNYKN